MDPTSLIPHYQPLPFPAPVWLLQTLLVLGFFLHVIPMNIALGGALTAAVCLISGKRDHDSYSYRIGKSMASGLPLAISFAITQGIVPLLFVQLLYGPMFYTSSILMAVPWFSIIFLLLVAYYAAYEVVYRHLKKSKKGVGAPVLLFGASLIFLCVAYLFTSNMTLMLTPDKWLQMYNSSSNGLNLPRDPQILPRLLHSVIAALAVSGLTMGCFGLYNAKRAPEYSKWLIKRGSLIFLLFSLVQIPIGLWFMSCIPGEIVVKFLGIDALATAAFAASMGLALVAILFTALSSATGGLLPFKGGLIAATGVILAMIVSRHELRLFYVSPYINPEKVPVSTQWDLLAIFVLSAVALIVFLLWLLKLAWKSLDPQSNTTASPALESSKF